MTERSAKSPAQVEGAVAPDGKKKPVSLFFVSHHPAQGYQLDGWRRKIEDILDSTPKGKVVVFTENAGQSHRHSNLTRQNVANGDLPSDAVEKSFRELNDHYRSHGVEWALSDERVAELLEKGTKTFTGISTAILDDIAARYPGRIDLVEEWESRKGHQLEHDLYKKDTPQRNTTLSAVMSLFPQGRRILAAEGREKLASEAAIYREREETSARIISDALEQPDTIAAVGWMGAIHTGLSHELTREGHPVMRVFPERVDGEPYLFPPGHTLLRAKRFDPDKELTDDEIVTAEQADLKGMHKQFGDPRINPIGFFMRYKSQKEEVRSGKAQASIRYAQEWYRRKMGKQASNEEQVSTNRQLQESVTVAPDIAEPPLGDLNSDIDWGESGPDANGPKRSL